VIAAPLQQAGEPEEHYRGRLALWLTKEDLVATDEAKIAALDTEIAAALGEKPAAAP
jgi:hypothetical protein